MKTPGIEHARLSAFVGKWNTEGTILASAGTPEIKIKGTDSYEWMPGNFFLVHKVDVLIGNDRNQTLEIIGFDDQSSNYTMQYYDNKGNTGKMIAACNDEVWTFSGDALRFTGTFSEGGNVMSGTWEQLTDDKTWTPFIKIKLVKERK